MRTDVCELRKRKDGESVRFNSNSSLLDADVAWDFKSDRDQVFHENRLYSNDASKYRRNRGHRQSVEASQITD